MDILELLSFIQNSLGNYRKGKKGVLIKDLIATYTLYHDEVQHLEEFLKEHGFAITSATDTERTWTFYDELLVVPIGNEDIEIEQMIVVRISKVRMLHYAVKVYLYVQVEKAPPSVFEG